MTRRVYDQMEEEDDHGNEEKSVRGGVGDVRETGGQGKRKGRSRERRGRGPTRDEIDRRYTS